MEGSPGCTSVTRLKVVEARRSVWEFFFFFSSRRRHTRFDCDWSSDVCSSDLLRRRPPELADVAPEGDAVGPVVVQPPETAVDLAGGVHEPAALAERRDLLHQIGRASCRERV